MVFWPSFTPSFIHYNDDIYRVRAHVHIYCMYVTYIPLLHTSSFVIVFIVAYVELTLKTDTFR